MDKFFTYEDVLFRIGHYRTRDGLSARELSSRLGCGESYINRIERKAVSLKVTGLIDIMNYFGVTPIEFFYPNTENFCKDKELIELVMNLSDESKASLIDIAKKLK